MFHAYIFIDFLWLLSQSWPAGFVFFDLFWKVKHAIFLMAAKQPLNRGSRLLIVLQNAFWIWGKSEFDDSCNMCNVLSRWGQLQDVKILKDSDLRI